MAEKTVKKVRRKKREERLGFNWFFWISFILLCIPVAYFLYLLYQAAQVSNTPIVGDRIKDTVIYTITQEDVSGLASDITSLDHIEGAEINLIVETLRVTVDATDELSKEELTEIATAIYEKVDAKFPISTYFTRDGEYKQYDLEIVVYDNLKNEEPIIVCLYKNGSMEDGYKIQVFSDPVNADVAYKVTHPETDEPEDGEAVDGSVEGGSAE